MELFLSIRYIYNVCLEDGGNGRAQGGRGRGGSLAIVESHIIVATLIKSIIFGLKCKTLQQISHKMVTFPQLFT